MRLPQEKSRTRARWRPKDGSGRDEAILSVQDLSCSLNQHYPALGNHLKIFRELHEFLDGDFSDFIKVAITHRIQVRVVSRV
jgi:hypothetical protein